MHPRNRIRPLNLQRLESRENPAGNVTTSIAGGVLTLIGSDQADSFTISQLAGNTFTITGTNGTTINSGASATTTAPATSIRMSLKEGNDVVSLDTSATFNLPGSLTIDAGDGNNSIDLETSSSTISLGSLSLTCGDGADSFFLGQNSATTSVTGICILSFGTGNSSASITNTTIGGDLTYKAAFGADSLFLTGVTAKKNVLQDIGNGDGQFSSSGNTAILGNLKYQALDGADTFTLNNTTVSGSAGVNLSTGSGDSNLSFAGTVNVSRGNLNYTTTYGTSSVSILGALTVNGEFRTGNQKFSALSNTGSVTAKSIALTGINSLSVSGNGSWVVTQNLVIASTGAVGSVFATFENLNVGGKLEMSASQSVNESILTGEVGSVVMTSRKSSADFSHTGTANLNIKGALKMSAFTDANVRYNSTGSVRTGGDITINSSSTQAVFENNDGDMTLVRGLNISGLQLARIALASQSAIGATINGDILVTSSGGSASTSLDVKQLTAKGKYTLRSLTSASSSASTTGTINFQGDTSLTSTEGVADFTAFGTGNVSVGGKMTLRGGNGAVASLTNDGLSSSVAGDVSLSTPRFASLFVTNGGKSFGGNVTLNGGSAGMTLNTTLSSTNFAKKLSITGKYANNNSVSLNSLYSLSGDATFKLGEGSQTISIIGKAGGVDFGGKLTIETGSGNDNIFLTGVRVAGAVSISTGGGSDFVSFDGISAFDSTLSLNTGAGDDFLDVGRNTGLASTAAAFNGVTTLLTGSGNDTVRIGRNTGAFGDANSIAVFNAAGSKLDAGTGLDSYDSTSLALPITNLTTLGF